MRAEIYKNYLMYRWVRGWGGSIAEGAGAGRIRRGTAQFVQAMQRRWH